MTSNNKHNDCTIKDMNPKVVVVFTAAGKIVRKNPNYDPHKCGKCGQRKSFFGCGCK